MLPNVTDQSQNGARPEARVVIIFPRRVGLFSLFLQVVGQIYLSRGHNIIPVVYFNDHSLYWSAQGYNGARNVWEYYFEPISEFHITDLIDHDPMLLESCNIWEFSNREVDPNTTPPLDATRIGSIRVPDSVVVSNLGSG